MRRRLKRTRSQTGSGGCYLPESILLEIVRKLPVKSTFRFKCLSKEWLALISDPSFSRFFHESQPPPPQPWTLLYNNLLIKGQKEDCILKLSPNDPKSPSLSTMASPSCFVLQRGRKRRTGLFWDDEIVAASDGWLLCSHELLIPSEYLYLYIFNPVTRERINLPPLRNRFSGPVNHGFLTRFGASADAATSYKVVRIDWGWVIPFRATNVLNFEVLCSETGQWRFYTVHSPEPVELGFFSNNSFAFNGILHWFNEKDKIIAYNPYESVKKCRLISVPTGRHSWRLQVHKMCEVCQAGYIRYFEVAIEIKPRPRVLGLIVWKLSDYDLGDWSLEHRVSNSIRVHVLFDSDPFKEPRPLPSKFYVPIGFHPLDSDILYLVHGRFFPSYDMRTKKLEVLAQSSPTIDEMKRSSRGTYFPFMPPLWPKTLPPTSWNMN